MTMEAKDQLERQFRERLTDDEARAIYRWHGLFSSDIWNFYNLSPGEREASDDTDKSYVRSFETAVEKGVPFTGRIYRGLSASVWTPDRLTYLRRLIEAPDEIVFCSPASATLSEETGRGWMRCGIEDEERHLAVLLICDCVTARLLPGFVHAAGDEREVVIRRGTRFRKIASQRVKPDPKPGLEAHEINLVEIN